MSKIKIQDTTLRDGEQTSGVAFTYFDKVKIINALLELGVDSIEIGFPAASKQEEKIIRKISEKFLNRNEIFCVFSRINERDILVANKVTEKFKNRRLQIVVPTSNSHIKYSINKTKKQIIKEFKRALKLAKTYFNDIQFTAQDAPRADRKLLFLLIKLSLEEGVNVIGLPDTVGFCTPKEYSKLIGDVYTFIKPRKNIVISAHCHNDLGLATANTIAAIDSGAKQVEVTLNGLGERAGNTSIEEVLAILEIKKKELLSSKIKLKALKKANELVQVITKIKAPHNKPIVGKNVFNHASGMHQKAVIKNKKSFEIINAKKFGMQGGKITIGKLSGKTAIKKLLDDNKIVVNEIILDSLMIKVKENAQVKKILSIKDIKNLLKKINK